MRFVEKLYAKNFPLIYRPYQKKILHDIDQLGSHQFQESLRELLRELRFSFCFELYCNSSRICLDIVQVPIGSRLSKSREKKPCQEEEDIFDSAHEKQRSSSGSSVDSSGCNCCTKSLKAAVGFTTMCGAKSGDLQFAKTCQKNSTIRVGTVDVKKKKKRPEGGDPRAVSTQRCRQVCLSRCPNPRICCISRFGIIFQLFSQKFPGVLLGVLTR